MYIDIHGEVRYKLGLHIHTTRSDGAVSPERAAELYRAAGFDAIAITDHWKYYNGGNLGGLKILSGEEFNLGAGNTEIDVMHIVGVGMNQDPECRPDMSRQEVVDRINQVGGIAVLAHPCWSLNRPEEAICLRGLAAAEIYNTVSDAHESFRPYSGYFADLLANGGMTLPLVASDDAHYYDGSDETRSFIMVRAESIGTEDLLKAVRQGNFYASQGPELLVRRDGRRIIVDCSPADKVVFISNLAWKMGRVIREKGTVHVEYTVDEREKWVRVEIQSGSDFAWSNIIQLPSA